MKGEKMPDLIDRQELISWLSKDPLFSQVEAFGLTSVIESRPSVDAVPEVRGGVEQLDELLSSMWTENQTGKPTTRNGD